MPSYLGPGYSRIGSSDGRGDKCQKCGRCDHVTKCQSGLEYCYKCWKTVYGIITRNDTKIEVNHTAYIREMAKRKFLPDGMYCMGGSMARYSAQAKKSIENEVDAILARVTNPMPHVDAALFETYRKFVMDHLPTVFDKLKITNWVTFEEWNSHFPASRRAINLKTWLTLRVPGSDTDVTAFDENELRKLTKQKPFLKMDKDPHDEGPIHKKAPRMIMAQSDQVAIVLGLVITNINKAIEDLWKYREDNGIVYACGATPATLSVSFAEAQRRGGRYLDNDFSQYDSTQHSGFCSLLCDIYSWIVDSKALEQLPPGLAHNFTRMRALICANTRGRTRFGMMLQLVGTMKSGQADTCLGNTLNNVFTHLFAFQRANPDLTFDQILADLLMHVLGDDNSTCVPFTWSVDGIEDTMERLGLMPKLVEKQWEDVEFLHLLPVPVEAENVPLRMTLMPGRILARLLLSHALPKDPAAHRVALSKCLMAIAGHCPPLSSFARALSQSAISVARFPKPRSFDRGLEKSQSVRSSFGWYLSNVSDFKDSAYATDATHQFYMRRYGLNEAAYQELLSRIENPVLLHSDWLINHVIDIDNP